MKFSLAIIVAVCGMIITSPALAIESKTDLSKVGASVDRVNRLFNNTVAGKVRSAGVKMPEITTSYVLGQGLTVHISAIEFTHKQSMTATSVTSQADPDATTKQETLLAGTKRASYRRKAHGLAHEAHHLREQSKSLKRSMDGASGQDKEKLNEQLKQVREEMKSVAKARKAHAKMMTALPEPAHSGSGLPDKPANPQAQFYQALEQDIVALFCQKPAVLALTPIDGKEKVSVVYQVSGDGREVRNQVKGWVIEKEILTRCGQGEVDQQYLAAQATTYQY